MSLWNFDTRSLIGVLVWVNAAAAILVFLFQKTNRRTADLNFIRRLTAVRALSALGYLLLFFRDYMNEFLSVNIGNTILFVSHYFEALIMIELTNRNPQRTRLFLRCVLLFDVLFFNVIEFTLHSPSLRVPIASLIILSIFIFPTVSLLTSDENNSFKKSVSIFYILLLTALIPRIVEPLTADAVHIHTNNYYQTLLFISLILIAMSNTIVYLLFMKERTDLVIEHMATYDGLTGLLNRHSFFLRARDSFDAHRKERKQMSLLFLDLDHFKLVNDRYGHQFGDDVLKEFAAIVKNNIRPEDLSCRYGGEEFVVLLSNSDEHVCRNVSERIMKQLEKHDFVGYPEARTTTSVGCTCGIPEGGESLESFIARSDRALYHAKKTGRNRMVLCNELADLPDRNEDSQPD